MTSMNTQSQGPWSGAEAPDAAPSMTAFPASSWLDPGPPRDPSVLARALEPYRDYLALVARRTIGPELRAKIGASDVVQETFLAAPQHIGAFRGRTEPEWRAWLKAILLHHLAKQRRHQAADKRRAPDDDPARRPRAAADAVTSPSRHLMRRERDAALAEALDRLPERYRRVVCWHHQDRLGFREIAERLGVSSDAAQKIWGRALVRRKELLGPEHDPPMRSRRYRALRLHRLGLLRGAHALGLAAGADRLRPSPVAVAAGTAPRPPQTPPAGSCETLSLEVPSVKPAD
jgi:RNA polymerase sigma-70 factor (ECF subfamily)